MIPAFLVTKFGPMGAKLVFFGGLALALLAAAMTIYFVGRGDGKSGEVIKEQGRTIELQNKVGDANTNAADARVNDVVLGATEQREIEDAIRNAKTPDDARALRGCVILRQQGRDTSGIPACGGFSPGKGTPVPR